MGDAIVVQSLGKRYHRYHLDRPWTFHEALLRGLRKLRPAETFWGLRDLSFKVAPGRMVGVMGRNGAGKSTLLRLLGGLGRPDEGSVRVKGRIGALLDLGAGFHPDLTGRENLFISGVVGGLTRREVELRLDSIIAFSELEDYLDSPLRAYSAGMQMRLAFSVAIHMRPDILLIDEALSVGDLAFQRKCLERIRRLKSEGCTIILVSHEVALIRDMCDEALWLHDGHRVAYGTAKSVVDEYLAEVERETHRPAPTTQAGNASNGPEPSLEQKGSCSLEMEITSARLLNAQGATTTEIDSGDPLSVEINYQASQPIDTPNFQVYIHRADGIICCDLATQVPGPDPGEGKSKGLILLHLERVDLNGGLYYIDVAAYKQDWSYAYDYHHKLYPLVVRPTGVKDGMLRPAHYWEIKYFQTRESQTTPLKAPSVYA